ncbi:MAG: hypothetical protein NZO16_05155 [Deltaproteobacteria bacterium]|nr:hypothetical protein [Deltaproteobacteria bacterium]
MFFFSKYFRRSEKPGQNEAMFNHFERSCDEFWNVFQKQVEEHKGYYNREERTIIIAFLLDALIVRFQKYLEISSVKHNFSPEQVEDTIQIIASYKEPENVKQLVTEFPARAKFLVEQIPDPFKEMIIRILTDELESLSGFIQSRIQNCSKVQPVPLFNPHDYELYLERRNNPSLEDKI